jgi:hypothetical protein
MSRLTAFCCLLLLAPSAFSQSFEPVVRPLIADGMEVVISAQPEKLALAGLKWAELREAIAWRRFAEGDWKVEFQEKELDLAKVAKIEIRKLDITPFKVSLPDGRELTIRPKIERVGGYRITGSHFVETVRQTLSDLFVDDPLTINVLSGIRNPGPKVPSFWACSPTQCINATVGEPLNELAVLELGGKMGPQIRDLEQMRSVRRFVEKTVEAEKNVPRADFERHFGVVKEVERQGWTYPLGKQAIQLWFDGTPEVVDRIYFLNWAKIPSKSPRDFGEEARATARADREFFLAFLQAKAKNATPNEINRLHAILRESEGLFAWTAEERQRVHNKTEGRRP